LNAGWLRPNGFPREKGRASRFVLGAFLLSLIFYGAARVLPFASRSQLRQDMLAASQKMAQAEEVLRGCRMELGLPIDRRIDLNATGLIGLEYSEITTSVGQLPAKRTSTNPNLAGLVVLLLHQAGVRAGDTIAVGASGSFPALILAVLSASHTLELKTLLIPSLGASQYGANHPEFHWLKMHDCLLRMGVFSTEPLAVSLGGDRDVAEDLPISGRLLLKNAVLTSGFPYLAEPELEQNVRLKMELYERGARGAGIKAFVNVGGSISNIGSDPEVLNLKPGVVKVDRIPPPERRGLIFAMAARKVPVVHLLFVRGLVQDHGLPYDPVPLPEPGEGAMYKNLEQHSWGFAGLSLIYVVLLVFLAILFPCQPRGTCVQSGSLRERSWQRSK
jgi:poly-gamma-glutamate system protein